MEVLFVVGGSGRGPARGEAFARIYTSLPAPARIDEDREMKREDRPNRRMPGSTTCARISEVGAWRLRLLLRVFPHLQDAGSPRRALTRSPGGFTSLARPTRFGLPSRATTGFRPLLFLLARSAVEAAPSSEPSGCDQRPRNRLASGRTPSASCRSSRRPSLQRDAQGQRTASLRAPEHKLNAPRKPVNSFGDGSEM